MKMKKGSAVKKPNISDLVKLEPEIQKRLTSLSKINKTNKAQTIAMIISWYFTRIDSTAKQAKVVRSIEQPTQVRSMGAA